MSITNNEFSSFGMDAKTPTTAERAEKLRTELDTVGREVKFDAPGGKASLIASQDQLTLTNASNGIAINQVGTVVDGLFHIGRQPSDVRMSTFWVFNNELLTGLPSTTYTPIPVLIYKEPPTVKHMAALMKFTQSLA